MNEGLWGCLRVTAAVFERVCQSGSAGRSAAAVAVVALVAVLGGCASHGDSRPGSVSADDSDGSRIADAVPRVEPLAKSGNPDSYKVRGKRYFPKKSAAGHVERGLASWYGKQFHGRKTSSGERYDMYAMTAAHKTLPLPSYVRVTNMENGRTAVVKVNDRGPFHGPRVIDLSYSAAKKLGVVRSGTAMVEVRAIDPAHPGADPGPFLASRGAAAPKMAARAAKRSVQAAAVDQPSAPAGTPPKEAPANTGAAVAVVPAVPSTEDLTGPADVAAATATPTASMPPKAVAEVASEPSPSAVGTSDQGLYLQVGAFGDPKNAERLRQRLVRSLSEQVRIQQSASSGLALYKVRIGPLGSEGQAKAISAKLVTLGVDPPRRVWN